MSTQPLPGFRDFYPAELAFRNHIFEAWRRVAGRYGFEEFDGPPLEPLELYTAKSGEEIVGQLYNFTDKGGREVSLRPELTPTVARMIAARAGGMKKPIRWFSIGQMFRYERQQKGRLKEFYQLNCDLIGEPGPLADAEMIALSIDLMQEFGLGPEHVRVRLSHRGLLQALIQSVGVPKPRVPAVFAVIDKLERAKNEDTRRRLTELGLSAAAIDRLLRILEFKTLPEIQRELDNPLDPEGVVEDSRAVRESFRTTFEALEAMALSRFLDIDLKIVRGLAYYTGTVFELFDAGRSLRAIAGGGRYDGLLQQLGGVDLPAVGFAIGDVVLGELLKDKSLDNVPPKHIDVFVAALTEDDIEKALQISYLLRRPYQAVNGERRSIRAEYSLGSPVDSLTKQLKLADARDARFVIVIGPEHQMKSEVELRDIKAKTREVVPENEVIGRLKALLANG